MCTDFKWDFLIETEELLKEIEEDIELLLYSKDKELMNRVFRAFHTIRGNAGMLEYKRTGRLSDYAEILVGMVRSGEMEPSAELIDTLLKVREYLLMLLGDIRVGRDYCSVDVDTLCHKLRGFETGSDGKGSFVREQLKASWEKRMKRKLRILIVEDDFVSRRILRQILSEYGDVDVAVDGKEALNIFTRTKNGDYEWHYDLICMDIMMPGINGLDTAKAIRRIEHDSDTSLSEEVFIIMVTAVSDTATVVKSLYKCGANSYIVKPIDRKKIYRELVNSHLIDKKS